MGLYILYLYVTRKVESHSLIGFFTFALFLSKQRISNFFSYTLWKVISLNSFCNMKQEILRCQTGSLSRLSYSELTSRRQRPPAVLDRPFRLPLSLAEPTANGVEVRTLFIMEMRERIIPGLRSHPPFLLLFICPSVTF